jgi:hypothetical protein
MAGEPVPSVSPAWDASAASTPIWGLESASAACWGGAEPGSAGVGEFMDMIFFETGAKYWIEG